MKPTNKYDRMQTKSLKYMRGELKTSAKTKRTASESDFDRLLTLGRGEVVTRSPKEKSKDISQIGRGFYKALDEKVNGSVGKTKQ